MPLGPNDLKNIALPANIDPAYLERERLADGSTYASLVADINTAFNALNASLLSGGLYGQLISLTTEATMEYRIGASNGFQVATEYALPDATRAGTTGHMLPLKLYDRALGWTRLFLPKARRVQLDSDIASAIQDGYDIVQKTILERFFTSTAVTGQVNGVGANGSSVPFADGGTADTNYVPVPFPDRQTSAFANTHSHFLRHAALSQANLEAGVEHLWEHGIDGPYVAIIPAADAGTWVNPSTFTGFVPRRLAEIQYASTTSLANVGEDFIGAITTKRGLVYLWQTGRLPTNYWGLTKVYGQNDPRNPLKLRYDPMRGFGFKLNATFVGQYPLQEALVEIEHGVGVGMDRCAGVATYVNANGSYVTPTIS